MSGRAPQLDAQSLTRRCNEALILGILAPGPLHGYQLALEIEARSGGAFEFKHGTLYPILHRLEKEGLIRGAWKQEGSKRRRKRYWLTRRGTRYLQDELAAWRDFFARFFAVVGDTGP